MFLQVRWAMPTGYPDRIIDKANLIHINYFGVGQTDKGRNMLLQTNHFGFLCEMNVTGFILRVSAAVSDKLLHNIIFVYC